LGYSDSTRSIQLQTRTAMETLNGELEHYHAGQRNTYFVFSLSGEQLKESVFDLRDST